ncbi:MAG: nucleotidyltransferase domain-containing protein [Thermomicrobiales bacterium]
MEMPTLWQDDPRIVEVVARMAATPGVVAVLLGGSRATGMAGPRSDVDLMAIVGEGEGRRDIFDAAGLTFDTSYWTLGGLEAQIAADGVTCDACRALVTLVGEATWEERIEATARRLCATHVPDAAQQGVLRAEVRAGARRLLAAGAEVPSLVLATWGGDLAWNAAKLCLAMVGIGPLREVHWHDALRDAGLPFDAATPYARWYTGGALAERIPAVLQLAEVVLGEAIAVPDGPVVAPGPPVVERRGPLGPEEAVELDRMVGYGLGKYGKALWTGDPVRRASEGTTILWFALPACLALAGWRANEQGWWRAIPPGLDLPFDAGDLYTAALIGESLAGRLAAAVELGERARATLGPIFRDTPHAGKYRRP